MTNQNIDDGLTEEERKALTDEGEDAGSGTTAKQNADYDGEQGNEDEEAEAAAKASSGEGAGEPESNAKEPEPDNDEEQQQSSPVLIASVSADAEAKLSEINASKAALLDSFDNGDMTAREYHEKLDALAKEERAIERQQDRADLAEQMEKQRLQNEWTQTCNTFIETNSVYKDNPRLYKALDQEVRELASDPKTSGWTGQKFLQEAHKNLTAAFNLPEPQNSLQKVARIRPELPPNLSRVPAADIQDMSGGRFAVLDRMASTDPIAYEEALNKMSSSERDSYLAAG